MKKNVKFLFFLSILIFFSCQKTQNEVNKERNTNSAIDLALASSVVSAANSLNALENCSGCHSETSSTGKKIQWAQEGWEESVHKNGYKAPMYAKTGTAGNASDWTVVGYEWHGSDAFYSNGGGCQRCHTHEGFREFVGTYALNAANYDASIGTSAVKWPSNIGCFTCHGPHENGSFKTIVANGTKIVTNIGTTYSKAKGNLCASCHQVRGPSSGQTVEAYILASVQGSGAGLRTTAHHGPQADMLMGKGGAEYPGYSYSNSAHTNQDNANCVTCHQVYDSDASTATRYGLSAGVGGHSFAVTGIVHEVPTAIEIGCKTSGCHTSPSAKKATADNGYIRKGDAYIDQDTTIVTDYFATLNTALVALANPDTNCTCLLSEVLAVIAAANGKTYTLKWETFADGTTVVPRCSVSSLSSISNPSANADSNEMKFARAYWNFMFVLEDKSFGVHNTRYATQLLVDSCAELKKVATASVITCPSRP